MNRIYKIVQYLSIDVAIGSIGSSILAVKVFEATIPLFYWLILPVCVWIIYTSDHLLDAIKVKNHATMGRHHFHYIHRKGISLFLVFSILISTILIFQHLDKKTIFFGGGLGFLVLSYLLINHYYPEIFRFFPRECIIAIGYMAGTWGIPFISKYPLISRVQVLMLISYFLIIFSIPLLYSIYEYKSDLLNGFISFSTMFGIKIAEYFITLLLVLSVFLSTYSFVLIHQYCNILLVLMAFILLGVTFYRQRLFINEKYRTISEIINLLPFLLLL